MKKKFLKSISIVLVLVLLLTAFPASAFAALSTVSEPATVTSFKSTTSLENEYLRAYVTIADDSVLKVIYRTSLDTTLFRLSLYEVGDNSGDIKLNIDIEPTVKTLSDGTVTYNFTYYLSMEEYDIADGYYNVYIKRCSTDEDAADLNFSNSGVLYKNMEILVSDGKVSILKYTDVIEYNREIRAIGDLYDTSLYLDTSLADINFVLKDPVTGVYDTLTTSKVNYIKTVSNKVTSGATTDYEKLLKIYEYTASNFYYDTIAFQTHSNQYANPYDNIRNFEYGLSSSNSVSGKVYTTCQGYCAIFIALARAQGIPTRIVYGHRLAVPSNDWLTEDDIDVRDHWWVEAYVDGEWIFIDPTVGTTNKYNSNTGVWTYTGLTNYTYFDPTEEQIATSHVYMNIYPDYRYGYYISNTYEISSLISFFNTYSNGTKNGILLNSSYLSTDKTTWGDGTKSHFMTDGSGNVAQIRWSSKGFAGLLDFSGFKYMKLFSAYGNSLTTVDLSDCTSLEKVYLYRNEITSLDLSNDVNLWYVRAQNNPMTDLTIYVNGKNRTFTTSGEHGTFYFTLNGENAKSFTLYSKADIGYKLKGVYSTATGNLLYTKSTITFTPKAAGYSIEFELDPDSYKYTLYLGDASSNKLPYIQAAAKRLAELGYYNPTTIEAGTESSFTTALKEAVIKFQVMNDLSNTGNIGQYTWSALFSQDAVEMVSSAEYQTAYEEYVERKAAEAEAKAEMSTLSIKASTVLGDGYIQVKWTVTGDVEVTDDLEETEDNAATIDGFEIWKSTKSSSGFKKAFTTTKDTYKNTAGLKVGTRYYYKVRAYKQDGS